ncbi:MAG: hypothetical protein OXC80_12540, partial [Gammaproteobacteria bacterium]|nr:hypothetical protein [Gammaproteobacteria bacterium]
FPSAIGMLHQVIWKGNACHWTQPKFGHLNFISWVSSSTKGNPKNPCSVESMQLPAGLHRLVV